MIILTWSDMRCVMLTYSFESIKGSLYEHLYKCIRDDIMSGTLPPDYKLPSKRSFAKNLSVSTITVENAYNQLLSEGFIYSLPRKGYLRILQTHIKQTPQTSKKRVLLHANPRTQKRIIISPISQATTPLRTASLFQHGQSLQDRFCQTLRKG